MKQESAATGEAPTVPGRLRMTPQREAVLTALRRSHDHPTASELYDRAKDYYPGLSYATVYNALRALKLQGLALELAVDGGPARYKKRK